MGKKMRKEIDLSGLPKKYGFGANKDKQTIDWKKAVGHKVHFIYDDIEGKFQIVNYQAKNRLLSVKYNNELFEIGIKSFFYCRIGGLLGKYTSDFKIEIGQTFKDDKRDITIIDRKYEKDKDGKNRKKYKYICNICGYTCGEHYTIRGKKYKKEHWIDERGLTAKNGCVCCNNIAIVEGINDIPTTAPWMIPYFQGGYDEAKKYTIGATTKIKPICPDCGRIKNKPMCIRTIYMEHSMGCTCGDGIKYPNKIMFNILEQLNLDFETEKRFSWCKYYNIYKGKECVGIYDFYIPSINKIIEMDGAFHKIDNNMNNQTAEESKAIDNFKDKLAKEHGIDVIRIDCDYGNNDRFEFIRKNIISKLSNIIKIQKIDWIKCNDFALSNVVKKVCEFKRDNPDFMISQVANIFHMNKGAIYNYLKQGTKLGWCNYDPKEEMRKHWNNSSKRNIERCSKPTMMFDKNMNLIYIFPSAMECDRKSEELFGVKLLRRSVSNVCTGKTKTHKNYIFKYATKEEYQEWININSMETAI